MGDSSTFFSGALMGAALMMFAIIITTEMGFGIIADAHNALDECEQSLPRDEHCEITATPINGD